MKKSIVTLLFLMNLGYFVLATLMPSSRITLSATSIHLEAGHNYMVSFDSLPVFPLTFGWDSVGAPYEANATVIEGSRRLGPGHSVHEDIRHFGAGRYSFWSGTLFFSTSDNSDPRGNGRTYEIHYRPQPHSSVTFAVLILDLIAFAIFRRWVFRFVLARRGWIAAGAVAVFACMVLLAAVGMRPPVFGDSAEPVDLALVGSIVIHLLFGLALTILTFAVGMGCQLWVTRDKHKPLPDVLLRAFLPGVIVVGAASLVQMTFRAGWTLAALMCIAALLPLLSFRPRRIDLARVCWTFGRGLPIVLLFATLTAFWWHGPTRTLASAPIGDTAIYVGVANTLTQHLTPLFNYAVEGFRLTYANILVAVLAAPWLGRPWFDPYLFYSASLGVFLGMSMFLLPLLRRQSPSYLKPSSLVVTRLIAGGLIAGAFRFPSDFVQSPPFVLLVPIIITTLYHWSSHHAGGRPWQTFFSGAVGTAISKLVAFIVLVPLAIPSLAAGLLRSGGLRLKLAAGAVGVVGLAYVTFVLVLYLPTYLKIGLGPTSLQYLGQIFPSPSMWAVGFLMRDIGAIVLAVAVVRSGSAGLAMGVSAGAVGFILLPFLAYAALTTAMLATAIAVLLRPQSFWAVRRLLSAATILLITSPLTPTYDNWAITAAWLCLVWLGIKGTSGESVPSKAFEAPLVAERRRLVVPAVTAALLGIVLAGAGSKALNVSPTAKLFTPDMRGIWLALRRLTPKDALIFTDQTGATVDRRGGWNDFALLAQRQFYLVSWEATPLRFDLPLRRQWLDRNAAVLSGKLDPVHLPLSRSYDGYFAVISKANHVGKKFLLIYENASFTLFRIGTAP